jgi:hypothetical protein
MKLDDSDAMLLFVAWGSDEDLRYITMFPEVLSSDTTYGTNREKRPLLVFAVHSNRKNFTALRAFILINYSHSRNPPCAPARTHGRIQAPREPPN